MSVIRGKGHSDMRWWGYAWSQSGSTSLLWSTDSIDFSSLTYSGWCTDLEFCLISSQLWMAVWVPRNTRYSRFPGYAVLDQPIMIADTP